ncbi:hypothetical protein SAMN03159338_4257 [Sphingomonas sp. NFR04]|uniref:hypothetical protein n=1 Tax=Sphingomonas sp. NFR04 TaxID=1566283 RepID=UPI0008F429E4|nr:hypothetical protein [Sphingomonas sp. NFR04]SFK44165.1 hypothetical protein SAMN03159338_4257 [Sphingomonas sp. NFR04]
MAKGRKRKLGKRTKTGQLSRAGLATARIDRGNDRAQAMRALYGDNCSDAIGRAFERGLLGSGTEAKSMLDTARAIHRAYWAWYANGPVRCALADRSGVAVQNDVERERRQEAWLNDMLRIAGRSGHSSRVLFDQLVVDINPDCGPPWLDRLLARHGSDDDWGRLSAALVVLAECAGIRHMEAKCA